MTKLNHTHEYLPGTERYTQPTEIKALSKFLKKVRETQEEHTGLEEDNLIVPGEGKGEPSSDLPRFPETLTSLPEGSLSLDSRPKDLEGLGEYREELKDPREAKLVTGAERLSGSQEVSLEDMVLMISPGEDKALLEGSVGLEDPREETGLVTERLDITPGDNDLSLVTGSDKLPERTTTTGKEEEDLTQLPSQDASPLPGGTPVSPSLHGKEVVSKLPSPGTHPLETGSLKIKKPKDHPLETEAEELGKPKDLPLETERESLWKPKDHPLGTEMKVIKKPKDASLGDEKIEIQTPKTPSLETERESLWKPKDHPLETEAEEIRKPKDLPLETEMDGIRDERMISLPEESETIRPTKTPSLETEKIRLKGHTDTPLEDKEIKLRGSHDTPLETEKVEISTPQVYSLETKDIKLTGESEVFLETEAAKIYDHQDPPLEIRSLKIQTPKTPSLETEREDLRKPLGEINLREGRETLQTPPRPVSLEEGRETIQVKNDVTLEDGLESLEVPKTPSLETGRVEIEGGVDIPLETRSSKIKVPEDIALGEGVETLQGPTEEVPLSDIREEMGGERKEPETLEDYLEGLEDSGEVWLGTERINISPEDKVPDILPADSIKRPGGDVRGPKELVSSSVGLPKGDHDDLPITSLGDYIGLMPGKKKEPDLETDSIKITAPEDIALEDGREGLLDNRSIGLVEDSIKISDPRDPKLVEGALGLEGTGRDLGLVKDALGLEGTEENLGLVEDSVEISDPRGDLELVENSIRITPTNTKTTLSDYLETINSSPDIPLSVSRQKRPENQSQTGEITEIANKKTEAKGDPNLRLPDREIIIKEGEIWSKEVPDELSTKTTEAKKDPNLKLPNRVIQSQDKGRLGREVDLESEMSTKDTEAKGDPNLRLPDRVIQSQDKERLGREVTDIYKGRPSSEIPHYKLHDIGWGSFWSGNALTPSTYLRWAAENTVGRLPLRGSAKQKIIDETLKFLVQTREYTERIAKANRDRLPGGDLGLISDAVRGTNIKKAAAKAMNAFSRAMSKTADKTEPINRPGKKQDSWKAPGQEFWNSSEEASVGGGGGGSLWKKIGEGLKEAGKSLIGKGDPYDGAPVRKFTDYFGNYEIGGETYPSFGIGTTINDLIGKSTYVTDLEGFREAIKHSRFITTPDKFTSTKDTTNYMTLDSNHVWEIFFRPFIGPQNGNKTWLPSFLEIDHQNKKAFNYTTHYSRGWLPITGFELQEKKLTSKDLPLFDGSISYPISMEFTNEIRITFADDSLKSLKRYFDLCAKVSAYMSNIHSPREIEREITVKGAGMPTTIVPNSPLDYDSWTGEIRPYKIVGTDKKIKTGKTKVQVDTIYSKPIDEVTEILNPTVYLEGKVHPGLYKNLSFLVSLYILTPQYGTIKKCNLLCVLKDYTIENQGETDSSPTELNVTFSIVGENPKDVPDISTFNAGYSPLPKRQTNGSEGGVLGNPGGIMSVF